MSQSHPSLILKLTATAILVTTGGRIAAQDPKPAPAKAPSADIEYFDSGLATSTSTAVKVGGVPLAFTSQLLPLNSTGAIHAPGDVEEQSRKVLQLLAFVLKEAETGMAQVVRLNVGVAQREDVRKVQAVVASHFEHLGKPAATFSVGELAHPNALVAMDAVATTSAAGGQRVARGRSQALYARTDSSHVAILPTGSRVFLSGQAAREPDLVKATKATMEQLRSTLQHLRLDFENVVQLRAFMKPMTSTAEVESEIAQHFAGRQAPPVVFVEWKNNNPIEIELIAAGGAAQPAALPLEFITPPGMKESPVFSRVVRVNRGRLIFVSGTYGGNGLDPATQTREIFRSLEYILGKNGSDLRHMVKATYLIEDNESSQAFNRARPEFLDPHRPPAASKASIPDVGREGHSILVDMIAVTRDEAR